MKKILILLYAAIIANQFTIAQVAINNDGTTPNSSAMLDIKSTSKGLLTPRMTTAQRNAIASPATGLMVYDTDVNKFFFYAIGSWIEMGTGSATNYWTLNGTDISKNNSGNVGIGTSTPQAPLHINNPAAAELLRLQGSNPYLSFHNAAGTYKGFLWQGPDDNVTLGTAIGNTFGALRFETNGALNMVVHPFGNVGVGTGILPPHKFTVQTTTSNHGLAHTDGSATVSSYVDASGGWLGTYSNHPLHFFTNNGNQQVTLLQNGNLGIGTTNPLTRLHINKDAEALRISGTGSYLSFYNGGSYRGYLWSKEPNNIELATAVGNTTGDLSLGVQGNPHLTVQSDGRVKVGALGCNISVGTFVPRLPKFSIQGPLGFKKSYDDQIGEWTIYYYSEALENNYLTFYFNGGRKAWIDDVDGSWETSSDSRLKENFENYKSVLDGLKKIDVLTYHYKADKTGRRSFGLVAQNLKQYFPELVSGSEGENSYLGISYAKTGVLAIKAIQEQQAIIEEQQNRIETLEKRLAALESKLR
jgi:Chaperone of endosialidase